MTGRAGWCSACGGGLTLRRLRADPWLAVIAWHDYPRSSRMYCPACSTEAVERLADDETPFVVLVDPVRMVELRKDDDAAGNPTLRRVKL